MVPSETYARERPTRRQTSERFQHRDSLEEFKDVEDEGGYYAGRRRTGLRLTFRGGVPQSIWGRVSAGAALLAILGAGWAASRLLREVVLRDGRFVLQSSSAILTEGNHHLSRAQLLDVFGGDLERSVLRVSLEERKVELEQIPWVRHATVMRLLPDHLRVTIDERVPVAFVRQGGHVGLVDAGGILLDMRSEEAGASGYSFPVISGISPEDPISVRAARMKIFQDFKRDLDAKGKSVSAKLSEVDLSDPEDVKALMPDGEADVLVHFGDSDFLERYEKFASHIGEWRSQYPKLSAVDMRYERQVVLEMRPGTAVPLAGVEGQGGGVASADASTSALGLKPTAKTPALGKRVGSGAVRDRAISLPALRRTKAGHP